MNVPVVGENAAAAFAMTPISAREAHEPRMGAILLACLGVEISISAFLRNNIHSNSVCVQ
jgi:hypothetical protein